MIKKQKKQLSNLHSVLFLFLLIPLVGFYVHATFIHAHQEKMKIFVFLAGIQIILLIYLICCRNRLIQYQAQGMLNQQDYIEKNNLLEVEIQKECKAIEAMRKKNTNLSELKGLTEKLSLCLSLEDTTKTLSLGVSQLLANESLTTILYLFNPQSKELELSIAIKGDAPINITFKKGDIFDQWVMKTKQSLLVEDIKSDYRFDMDRINNNKDREVRSLISLPLMSGNKELGILRIESPQTDTFDTEDLRFLKTIADLAVIAIENAQLYEQVEDLAIKDSLTDLYLRRYLLERMGQELPRELKQKKELSFLMLDLDKFKQYNDKFGHVAGDIVLRTVGLILKDTFQHPGDLICRYGGEEFAILLPDCPKEKAVALAESLRKKIELQTVILRREKTKITVSIGVAAFPTDAQMKEELIQRADDAMYQAKQNGRNRVCAA